MKTSLLLGAALLVSIPATFAFADHHEEGAKMAEEGEPMGEAPAEEAAPAAKSFKVDGGKTFLAVKTQKAGIGEALAHDHVIVATQMKGDITFSESDPSKNAITVEVDVPSLMVDDPSHLTRVGHPEGEGPDADDRASIKKNMLAEDQLNGAKFKTISFKSTQITPKGGGKYEVKGDLTLRGVTQPVTFPATVAVDGGTFHGQGELTFTHAQFGFEPYSAAFGAIRNAEELTLMMDIYGS